MLSNDEDKAMTKNLHRFKECGSRRTLLFLFFFLEIFDKGLDILLKRSGKQEAQTRGTLTAMLI